MKQQLQEQRDQGKPAKPLTRDQVREYLTGIGTLVSKAGGRRLALVRSLVTHHNLRAWMLDGQTMKAYPPGHEPNSERSGRLARATSGLRPGGRGSGSRGRIVTH